MQLVVAMLYLLFALAVSGALAHGYEAEPGRSSFRAVLSLGLQQRRIRSKVPREKAGEGQAFGIITPTVIQGHFEIPSPNYTCHQEISDNFCTEKIEDRSNGDIAADQYHRYKEDVSIMKDIGFDAYGFSISWPRILPNGSLSGGINREGVDYYNKLIDELLRNGVQPFATLFYSDAPQGLEDQYGGFLSHSIVRDYRDYAEVCFREFGDRVKHWITFNGPYAFSKYGYASDVDAPGRCSPWDGKCSTGDSSIEPYIVGHHQLLAHAAAVNLYKDQFQESQKGKIGITLDGSWMVPYSNSKSDSDAVTRARDFKFGWFMDPLTQGDYPFIMRALVGSRLPKFTKEQSKQLKGSFDFIGLNYYTTTIRNGIPIGSKPFVYPEGLHDLLLYTKNKYNNPVVYITENGVGEGDNAILSLAKDLKDKGRIGYYRQHLHHVQLAIRGGVDVRGFFAWSLLDNFEWTFGYNLKFGIVRVDYKDGLRRCPKSSALWFQKLLKQN